MNASPHSQLIHHTVHRPQEAVTPSAAAGASKKHPTCKNPGPSPTSFQPTSPQTALPLHQHFNTHHHLHHPCIFNPIISFHSATCHSPTSVAPCHLNARFFQAPLVPCHHLQKQHTKLVNRHFILEREVLHHSPTLLPTYSKNNTSSQPVSSMTLEKTRASQTQSCPKVTDRSKTHHAAT